MEIQSDTLIMVVSLKVVPSLQLLRRERSLLFLFLHCRILRPHLEILQFAAFMMLVVRGSILSLIHKSEMVVLVGDSVEIVAYSRFWKMENILMRGIMLLRIG